MKGCPVAVGGLTLSLLLIVAGLPVPAGMAAATAERRLASIAASGPTAMAEGPVSWHPIVNTSATTLMYVDAVRGRIITVQGVDVGVMDLNGTVLATVLSVLTTNDSVGTPQGYLDPGTGYLYLLQWHVDCKYNGVTYDDSADLTVVDTVNATVLHRWWYPIGLVGFALHAGRIYASHETFHSPKPLWCFLIQDSTVTVLNASDGTILQNITGLPAGYITTPPAVAPSGSWLFADIADLNWKTATYRLNLTSRTSTSIGPGGVYAFSPDGRNLYACDPTLQSLRAYSVATGAYSGGGSCGGAMAVNPLTGMIASDGSGTVTQAGSPVSFTPRLTSVAWSPDGRSLMGVNPSSPSPTIGAWSGTPIVSTTPTVFSPWKSSLRVRFDSVEGVNRSSLQWTFDGRPFTEAVTWPLLWQGYVNVTSLPDGLHTMNVAGTDVVGRPFQGNGTFETDGSPPVIQILSTNRTNLTPYGLVGRLNESHPSWVTVNGGPVPLTGTSWMVQEPLRIGDNHFLIEAGDTLGNVANRSFHVFYWPDHSDNLTNAADHISVFVPPSWTGQVNVSLGNGALANATLSMLLIGPPDESTAATFIVTALPLPDAQGTQDYVLTLARWQRDLVKNLGGVIIVEPWNDTLDGHPAVTFEALLTSGSDTTVSMVTVAVSSAWKLEYILTFDVSVSLWPAYTESREWILQGFHIESPPPSVVAPAPGGPAWVVGLATGGLAGVAVVAVAVWLLRRRRGGAPPDPQTPR